MKIKYNWDYDRYVTEDGKVLRYDSKQDKLVLCKLSVSKKGYLRIGTKAAHVMVHRLVYETFIGEIPPGYEIDHINTIRGDNRLENLRVVTHRENTNNPLTRKHRSDSMKGKEPHNKGKTRSDFGRKFKDHFGMTKFEDPILYAREQNWYYKHGKTCCRWEK